MARSIKQLLVVLFAGPILAIAGGVPIPGISGSYCFEILTVEAGSPAELSNLAAGDLVCGVDRSPINEGDSKVADPETFTRHVSKQRNRDCIGTTGWAGVRDRDHARIRQNRHRLPICLPRHGRRQRPRCWPWARAG